MNGHKNWNHWNVALWINNDEGNTHTPDGTPYTKTAIREALRGI